MHLHQPWRIPGKFSICPSREPLENSYCNIGFYPAYRISHLYPQRIPPLLSPTSEEFPWFLDWESVPQTNAVVHLSVQITKLSMIYLHPTPHYFNYFTENCRMRSRGEQKAIPMIWPVTERRYFCIVLSVGHVDTLNRWGFWILPQDEKKLIFLYFECRSYTRPGNLVWWPLHKSLLNAPRCKVPQNVEWLICLWVA